MRLALTTISSAALIAFAAPALASQDEDAAPAEATNAAAAELPAEKPKKITDRRHPDYVRCKSEKVIGSLAKRKRICLTNRQWAEVARDQNALAREFAAENTNRAGGGS